MGFIDSLQGAGQAIGKYLGDRFGSVGNAYKTAWKDDVPGGWNKLWGGVFTMAMSPGENRDSFWKGLGLWLDGAVGLGGGLFKGTVGGAFELPGLHEPVWAIDKFYRYATAYPLSYVTTTPAFARLEMDEAERRGEDPTSAYIKALVYRQPFGSKGVWSADVRQVTPGQALVWGIGSTLGWVNPSNSNDRDEWLRTHDPRTPEGQAAYNSEEANPILKYGSGTFDFFSAIFADPTMAVGAGAKLARARIKDVATSKRLADPKFIEKEVSDAHFEKMYQVFRDSESPDEARARLAPRARMGNAFVALHTAAQVSRDLFRDAYVVARGVDGLYMPVDYTQVSRGMNYRASAEYTRPTNALGDRNVTDHLSERHRQTDVIGAQARILQSDPDIVAAFSREFATWNIGEDAAAFGEDVNGSRPLKQMADIERATFERVLTTELQGKLLLEERPRVRALNELRLGIHSWADGVRSVNVGFFTIPAASRRVGRFVRAFMPSRGFTEWLDVRDLSSMSTEHFKANLIRAAMAPYEVEYFASRWAANPLPEARHMVANHARQHGINVVAKRHGLDPKVVEDAIGEIARRDAAVRWLAENAPQYVSEQAARMGAVTASMGVPDEAKWVRDEAGAQTRQDRKGEFGYSAVGLPNADGVTDFMIQDTRIIPGYAPDPTKAVFLSQTERFIPMIDFQALDGQLKWWKWQQGPGRLNESKSTPRRFVVDSAGETELVEAQYGASAADASRHIGQWTLAKAAKTKAAWDRLINASDFASMIWKSSALLRPAQTPRNLADDLLRRMFVFGKLPMLMSAMRGTPRAVQNFGRRGEIVHEWMRERIVARKADRTGKLTIEVDDPINHAPHNNELADAIRLATARLESGEWERAEDVLGSDLPTRDLLDAWADGMISWRDMYRAVRAWNAHPWMPNKLGRIYDLYTAYRMRNLTYGDIAGQGPVVHSPEPPPVTPPPKESEPLIRVTKPKTTNAQKALAVDQVAKAVKNAGIVVSDEIDKQLRDELNFDQQRRYYELRLEGADHDPALEQARGHVEDQTDEAAEEIELKVPTWAREYQEREAQAAGPQPYVPPRWATEKLPHMEDVAPGDFPKGAPRNTSPLEEERLFKLLMLQHVFSRRNQEVAFLRDTVASPTDRGGAAYLDELDDLERERLGLPKPKVEESKGKKPGSRYSRANKMRQEAAQNTVIAYWVREVLADHIENAQGYTRGDGKAPPGHIFVNPFDDITPLGLVPDDMDIIYHKSIYQPITTTNKVSQPAVVAIETFILDHLDDLMRPDHSLSLSWDTVGHIRAGVARAKPELIARGAIKPSAAFRLKNFKFDEIVDAGHQIVSFVLADGRTWDFQAAFDGPSGQMFQNRVSAVGGLGTWQYLLSGWTPYRMMDQMGGFGRVIPGQKGYEEAWERAVNAHIAGDDVAVRLVQGRPPAEVIQWAERTPVGNEWIRRMHFLGVNYVKHIHTLAGVVATYVPFRDTAAGARLRQAVVEQRASFADLKAAEPDIAQWPEVHGATLQYNLGKGSLFHGIARNVDLAQRILADIPTDKASRFPMFAESYRRHLAELVRVVDSQTKIQAAAAPPRRKVGLVGREGEPTEAAGKNPVRSLIYDPDTGIMPVETMRALEDQARHRAYYDTKYYLYDVTQMNDVARLTRLIVPFSTAIVDSYIKYGRIIRDTGGAPVLQGLYYWDMFERNEMIQDENGYALRKGPDGEDQFYKIDPDTGEATRVPDEEVGTQRYVQFRLPSDLGHMVGKKYFGVDMAPVFAVNKRNFNVFIDLPASGPLIALPVNEFALDNPEFGESQVIQRFVLPYGPSSDRAKVALPSTVRSAWEVYQGQEGGRAEAMAKSIFQAEMISYARGEREQPPSLQEARQRSAMMWGLRFGASWITPVSFQTKSPYQPYIDTYKQLIAEDPASADEKFYARYGDEFYAISMATTRNNLGMTASLKSRKAFDAHKKLVEAYPDLGSLITGDTGGAFSKAVYEWQKETPIRPGSKTMIREVLSLDDSVQEMEKRRVWDAYSRMSDAIDAAMIERGLKNLNDRRAKDLLVRKNAFIEENRMWRDPASGMSVPSPWFEDYSTHNPESIKNRIDAMWNIVQDKNLQKRDDIRGLIDYLSAREEMQSRMKAAKVKSLTSSRGKRLAYQWDAIRLNIREQNVMFAPVWARYLSRDDELEL